MIGTSEDGQEAEYTEQLSDVNQQDSDKQDKRTYYAQQSKYHSSRIS